MLETTDCLKFPLKLTKARRSNPDVHHSSPCQQAQTSSKTFMLPVSALVLAHVRPRAPPNTVSLANLVIGSTALLSDHKPVSRGEGSLSIASAHSNYPFFSSFERPCARQDHRRRRRRRYYMAYCNIMKGFPRFMVNASAIARLTPP